MTTVTIDSNSVCSTRRHTLGVLTLAAFLTAGLYKLLPVFRTIPVDLTGFLAVLTTVLCATTIIGRGFRIPRMLWIPLLLFMSFLPAIGLSLSTPYSRDKVTYVFTLGLLAAIGPIVLIRSNYHVQLFFTALSALGIVTAVLALTGHINPTQLGRYTVLDANTTQTGRIAGVALVWVIALATRHRIRPSVSFPFIGLLSVALIGTGARGPLLAAIASVVLVVNIRSLTPSNNRGRRILLIAGVILTIVIGYHFAPFYARTRLLTVGNSGQERLLAYWATLRAIPTHPLGIGWGNWAAFVGPAVASTNQYPHNLFLEVFIEGGWIPGLTFSWFLARVLRAAIVRARHGLAGRGTCAVLIFYLLNSLVSDDLVGARMLFAICSVVLAQQAMTSSAPSLS